MTMRESIEVYAVRQDFHHEGEGYSIGVLTDGSYLFSDGDMYTRAQLVEMGCGARFMTLPDLEREMSAAYAAGQRDGGQWRMSVDEALIQHGLECTSPADVPLERVTDLARTCHRMAVDPLVSADAAALIAQGQRADASKDSREAFMCLVDYEHELGFAAGAHKVYGAIEDLRATRPCVEQCGIARVRVVLEEVVQKPDYSTAEPMDSAAIRNRKEQG